MAETAAQKEAEKSQHPTHKGDLAYTDTHKVGVDQVHALIHKHGASTPPERVAELVVEHGHKEAIAHFIISTKGLGTSYWKKVEAEIPNVRKTNHVNVGFNNLNRKDQGFGTDGADPNRLEEHDKTHKTGHGHGIPAKVHAPATDPALLYKNDGSPFPGHVANGRTVEINTGAVKAITIAGTAFECVLAFHILDSGVSTTGWIRVDHLDGHGKTLAGVDAKIAGQVDKKREESGLSFAPTPHTVQVKPPPADIKNLRLAASTSKSHDTANLPDHYYARGSVVNLLSQVPNSGSNPEKKFGIANDVLVAGTKFYISSGAEEHVQLYRAKSDEMTDKTITFVYGKAEPAVPGQPASYGWINKDLLA
ncbi:MAG: hypothetical protein QM831_19640 [Kofleriaceae bacterium]